MGSNYLFLINDSLVYSRPFVKFYGNGFGFGASNKTEIVFDYFKISYIDSK